MAARGADFFRLVKQQEGTCGRVLAGRSPRGMPGSCPPETRGRRECRMLAAPMARQQKKKLAADTTGSAETIRHSLRGGFNGVLRALPGNRAFLLPSPAAFVTPARLTPASGCQDHTTSPSASAPFVRTKKSRASPKRPPQSRLTCRDDRDAPLFIEAGCAENTRFSGKRKQNLLRGGRMVESVEVALNCLANFRFSRAGFSRAAGARWRHRRDPSARPGESSERRAPLARRTS